jgi:hypothetical protein
MIVEMEHPRIGNARLLGNPIKCLRRAPRRGGQHLPLEATPSTYSKACSASQRKKSVAYAMKG